MENVARVVLALEAHDVAEEVMHFLDRSGRARVVATAGDDRQLAEAVRQLEPDAVIAQPSLVTQAAVEGSALLAVDTRESVGSLRAALDAGARGYFVWPSDREDLVRAAAITRVAPIAQGRRARVVAVHGARGGVGTTFVATHLVAAAARRGADSVLIGRSRLRRRHRRARGARGGRPHDRRPAATRRRARRRARHRRSLVARGRLPSALRARRGRSLRRCHRASHRRQRDVVVLRRAGPASPSRARRNGGSGVGTRGHGARGAVSGRPVVPRGDSRTGEARALRASGQDRVRRQPRQAK